MSCKSGISALIAHVLTICGLDRHTLISPTCSCFRACLPCARAVCAASRAYLASVPCSARAKWVATN
eukprot:414443-Alexandrium_andersonii.AAC.1